jgi:protein associated with RNAse G/E
MTTPPAWSPDGDHVTMVDLDLDVVRTRTGQVYVDDEDEFAQHQVQLGYPADVVALAQGSCEEVLAAVRAEQAPFSPQVWQPRLASLG